MHHRAKKKKQKEDQKKEGSSQQLKINAERALVSFGFMTAVFVFGIGVLAFSYVYEQALLTFDVSLFQV